jgi:hypothetical protein
MELCMSWNNWNSQKYKMDDLTYYETLFSYLYISSALRWQDMELADLELIPEVYVELIKKQFIPCTLIDHDWLSMAITLASMENVIVESQLTPSAAWLVGYMIDLHKEICMQNGWPRNQGQAIQFE